MSIESVVDIMIYSILILEHMCTVEFPFKNNANTVKRTDKNYIGNV